MAFTFTETLSCGTYLTSIEGWMSFPMSSRGVRWLLSMRAFLWRHEHPLKHCHALHGSAASLRVNSGGRALAGGKALRDVLPPCKAVLQYLLVSTRYGRKGSKTLHPHTSRASGRNELFPLLGSEEVENIWWTFYQHLYHFTEVWITWCWEIVRSLLNGWQHFSHLWHFSSVWIIRCSKSS